MNTIFVLGHPHTRTSPEFFHHGFTVKTWNLCKIFASLGRKVVHLGCEGSCPPGAELVDVTARSEWDANVGLEACLPPPPDESEAAKAAGEAKIAPYNTAYASRCRAEIAARCDRPNQAIVAVPWGGPQWDAVSGLQQVVLEAGIGYYPKTQQRWRV